MAIPPSLQVSTMNEPGGIANKQLLAEGVHTFSLSPDGKQIILCSNQGLKKLSLKTGHQSLILPLTRIGRIFSWSPDKRWFVFWRLRPKPQPHELSLINLQNNRLYSVAKAQGFAGFALSPDGKRLAWIKEEGKVRKTPSGYYIYEGKVRRSLVIGMLKGTKITHPKVLYYEGRDEMPPDLEGVQWTPDGQFLVFRSLILSSGGQIPRLGVIRPDGTGLRWIAPKPPPSRKGFPIHEAFTIYSWAVSPDSKTIAFGFGGDIWLCQVKEIKEPIKIASKYTAIELCWSPDGKGLLLVSSSPKALPPAPGCLQRNPPHQLHWVSRDGQKHCLLLEEEKGIYDLQWVKGKDIFYLSGSSLWKVTLKF